MAATSLDTISIGMRRMENDLDPAPHYQEAAKAAISMSITILAVGIIFSIVTTRGIYWQTGALATSLPIGVSGLVYGVVQYKKSKNCAQETADAATELARGRAFEYLALGEEPVDVRKKQIVEMTDMGYMAFLKHVETVYFPEGQLEPRFASSFSGLPSSLKAKPNWEALVKRADVNPAMIRQIKDA